MPSDIAERGSIIVVVATDCAPVATSAQTPGASRSARVGTQRQYFRQRLGDLFIAFSTANKDAGATAGLRDLKMLPNDSLDVVFGATVAAIEEAIVNAMVAARDMTGADGHRVIGFHTSRCRKCSESTTASCRDYFLRHC